VTTTSRPIRTTETNGIDYHFLSKLEFESKIHTGDLIEYAIVHTNYYGSTYSELDRIIQENKSPIYIIEPQ
jgi:guanylate kinase